MFLGATVRDSERPAAAVRRITPSFPETVYLEFCKAVCGAVMPLKFWHDENISLVETFLVKFGTHFGPIHFRDQFRFEDRARLRAACYHAARG